MDRPLVETQIFSTSQYDLVFYFLVIAGLALAASFVRSWTTRTEVGARYRPAVIASLCITGVAAVSYLVLIIKWDTGFDFQGGSYVPNAESLFTVAPRYMDWSVTVPLLTVELLAVCAVAGRKAMSLRITTMGAAWLMIFTGFLGAKVIDEGTDVGALWLWGLISTAFMVYLYTALILAVRDTVISGELSAAAGRTLRAAVTVLLVTFVVYPLAYAVPVFFDPTPAWTTTIQIAFCVADIIAKAGFGAMIHKVAKLRTADDVNSGTDTQPESVWVSNVRHSQAVLPPIKAILAVDGLADGARPVGTSRAGGR